MKVKCKFCGYEWKTKSKMIYVSCPSCLRKVKIREIRKKDILTDKKGFPINYVCLSSRYFTAILGTDKK